MANDIVALRKDGPIATVKLATVAAERDQLIELIELIGRVFESVSDDPSMPSLACGGIGQSLESDVQRGSGIVVMRGVRTNECAAAISSAFGGT